LTRLTPFTDLPILGFSRLLLRLGSLGFFLGWTLSAIPWAGCYWFLLELDALTSPRVGCSRLLLRLDALSFSSGWMLSASPPLRWVGVPARRSDAKVRNGFMFIRQKSLLPTSYVDLLFIQFPNGLLLYL